MRRRSLFVALLPVLLVVLGGCDTNDGRDKLFTTEPRPTTTLALTTTSTTVPLTASVSLSVNGAGVVGFGRPAATAEDALGAALGQPHERMGPFTPASTAPWGVCPGDSVRGLRWGGFTVLLTTGQTDVSGASAAEHFSAFYYGSPGQPVLSTDRGATIGTTVAQLRTAYGAELEVFEEEPVGPSFEVGEIDEYPHRLFGALSSITDDGTVASINSGVLCGE